MMHYHSTQNEYQKHAEVRDPFTNDPLTYDLLTDDSLTGDWLTDATGRTENVIAGGSHPNRVRFFFNPHPCNRAAKRPPGSLSDSSLRTKPDSHTN